MTDEAVTIGLDDDRIKFFADRLLEVARIKAATEPYEGECDQEDLASYAGEVVKLRRALLDARAEHAASLIRINAEAVEAVAQARADAQAAVALDGDALAKLIREAEARADALLAKLRATEDATDMAINRLELLCDEAWNGDARDFKRSLTGVFHEYQEARAEAAAPRQGETT